MDIFIGSQNIYDREGKIVACELLYRNSLLNKYDESVSSETASCTIIKNIISGLLLDINLLLGKEIDEILDEIHMSNEVDNALRGHS